MSEATSQQYSKPHQSKRPDSGFKPAYKSTNQQRVDTRPRKEFKQRIGAIDEIKTQKVKFENTLNNTQVNSDEYFYDTKVW